MLTIYFSLPVRFWGFPSCSDGKESAYNVGDLFSIPGLGRSPGGGHGNPLQYSCLENDHGQRSLVGYSPQCRSEIFTFVCFLVSNQCSFHLKNDSLTFLKVGLVVMNSFNFCLSGELLISSSILNDNLSRQRILGWKCFFSSQHFEICHVEGNPIRLSAYFKQKLYRLEGTGMTYFKVLRGKKTLPTKNSLPGKIIIQN